MGKLIYFYFLVCFTVFVSCKTEQITTSLEDHSEETKVEETQELTNSPFSFIEVAIEGDTLITQVQYSGGCGNHQFKIEKNLPPKQPILITHRSDKDPCRALIREELKFYIGDFKGTPNGTTVLLLENWPQQIIYSY